MPRRKPDPEPVTSNEPLAKQKTKKDINKMNSPNIRSFFSKQIPDPPSAAVKMPIKQIQSHLPSKVPSKPSPAPNKRLPRPTKPKLSNHKMPKSQKLISNFLTNNPPITPITPAFTGPGTPPEPKEGLHSVSNS